MEINDLRYIVQAIPKIGQPFGSRMPDKITGAAVELVEQVAQMDAEQSFQGKRIAITLADDGTEDSGVLVEEGLGVIQEVGESCEQPNEENKNKDEVEEKIRLNTQKLQQKGDGDDSQLNTPTRRVSV